MGIGKRRSRVEQSEEVRRRLLVAARTVFCRDGYHAATLDEVVRTAGFTKGVVYSRFASKADLFLALLEEQITRRAAEVAEARRAGAGGVDAMFRGWLERTKADEAWALLVVEFRVAAARDRALNARYAALHERVVAGVAEQARLAAEDGGRTLALPADRVARLGLAFATGVLLEHAAAPERLPEAVAAEVNARLFEALQQASPRRKR